MTKATNVGGRPVAINDTWLDVAEEVVSDPGVIIARTDEDIVDEINYKLKLNEQNDKMLSLRTYQRYKAKVINKSSDDIQDIAPDIQILIDRFWRIIKKKLRIEKLNILAHFAKDKQRQRRAWIYERKFSNQRGLSSRGEEENKTALEDTQVTEVEVIIKRPEDVAID